MINIVYLLVEMVDLCRRERNLYISLHLQEWFALGLFVYQKYQLSDAIWRIVFTETQQTVEQEEKLYRIPELQ